MRYTDNNRLPKAGLMPSKSHKELPVEVPREKKLKSKLNLS